MTNAPATTSPCNDVCRMDAASGWCEGCQRTLDEIVRWSTMLDGERRAVWARIEERRSHRPATGTAPTAVGSGQQVAQGPTS